MAARVVTSGLATLDLMILSFQWGYLRHHSPQGTALDFFVINTVPRELPTERKDATY
jgi:hypothetical protein